MKESGDRRTTDALREEGTTKIDRLRARGYDLGYGHDADLATLRRISDATNASTYDASDPTTIDKVFTAVVSNF